MYALAHLFPPVLSSLRWPLTLVIPRVRTCLESFTFVNRVSQQISQKKLKKFEKEYHTLREQQEQQEAPIERYEVAQRDSSLLFMFTGSYHIIGEL